MSSPSSISLDSLPRHSSQREVSQQETPQTSLIPDHLTTHANGVQENSGAMEVGRPNKSKHTLWDRVVSNWWGLELSAWLLATLTTLVIIIVFACFDQKLVSSWHSGLTPNALVQVLSQIAQTAILVPVTESISQLKWFWFHKPNRLGDMPGFAEASTGPFASLWLVRKHRGVPLVYLGAACAWLILLFGPFAQQALQTPYPLREVEVGTGSIPRSLTYQAGSSVALQSSKSAPNPYLVNRPGNTDSGGQSTSVVTGPPDGMREAISNGLFSDSTTLSAVAGNCDTGNCTWDPYQSLRIYATVDDVTTDIVTHCPRGRPETENGCIYSVPDIEQHPTPLQSHMQSDNQSIWIGASNLAGGYMYPSLITLTEFYVIYLPDLSVLTPDSEARNESYTDHLKAYKGTLSLGLSTLHTSMRFGATITGETDILTDLDWKETRVTVGHTSYDTISTSVPGNREVFWMDTNSRMDLGQYLSSAVFLGHGGLEQGSLSPDSIYYTTDTARLIGVRLYQGGDQDGLSKLLDSLATSMTNA
ncbi:MAG: hypothetical protein Q9225_004963 [Loekoesia sp. 1 TL-2023]